VHKPEDRLPVNLLLERSILFKLLPAKFEGTVLASLLFLRFNTARLFSSPKVLGMEPVRELEER